MPTLLFKSSPSECGHQQKTQKNSHEDSRMNPLFPESPSLAPSPHRRPKHKDPLEALSRRVYPSSTFVRADSRQNKAREAGV